MSSRSIGQKLADTGLRDRAIEPKAHQRQMAVLIGNIAAGDNDAMSMLYDSTSRLIYGLVLRIVTDQGVAEEVLLDVYMQAWRKAAEYDEKRGGPLAWMTTMARSRAIDRLRSGKQRQRREESLERAGNHSSTTDVEADAFASEMRDRVRAALDLLSPAQREVIELAYYCGMSHSEIAAQLNQPLGTIKTRTRLGMIKLRETLKGVQAERVL